MSDTYTLPYTGERVPQGMADLAVKIAGEMQSRDGIAFNAGVWRDNDLIGVIENKGDGGGTWFHHHTAKDMHWWRSMVEQFKPIIAEDEPEYGDFMAEESLADRLYENAAMFRDLNRKRSVIIRIDGDNDDIRLYKGTWDAQLAAHFAAEKVRNRKTIERWVKNEGWVNV